MAKKRAQVPTPEERDAFELQQRREEFINEPTVRFSVGERVIYGGHDKTEILESFDGGKIFLVRVFGLENVYGKMVPYDRRQFIAWHQMIPLRTWKDSERRKTGEGFRLSYYQTSVEGIIHSHYAFGVDFDPPYQRGLVWELADKQSLIESIFQDVDIGKFVMRKLPFAPHPAPAYQVIDGKQRLTALIEYFEGRFAWRGRLFRDLHPFDRSHFNTYPISKADLREDCSDEHILQVFVRLNTSGKPMDPAHLERVRRMLEGQEANDGAGKKPGTEP